MEKITPIIVGANGWLGQSAQYLIKNQTSFKSPIIFGSVENTNNQFGHIVHPLTMAKEIFSSRTEGNRYIILNFSYLTKDKVSNHHPDKYAQSIITMNSLIADLVAKTKPLSFLFMSSGAATLVEKGQIIAKDMDLYGRQKLRDELAFNEICQQFNVKYLAPRLFNIGGPFINKLRLYAISNFILQGLETGSITVKAPNFVYRSYCHVYDLLNVLLCEMGDEELLPVTPTFEVGGDEVVEMADLAKHVATALLIPPQNIYRPVFDDQLAADYYLADNRDFNKLASKHKITKTALPNIIQDTVKYLQAQKNS